MVAHWVKNLPVDSTHIWMVNAAFSPKVSRSFNKERRVSLSNHVGTSRCPHVSQVTQKLAQDGPKCKCKR